MQAYRQALRRPGAGIGRQPEPFAGTSAWLLPNPSGLQARYQLPELVELYGALRSAAYPAAASLRSGQ
jgi:TDG/mug DNA glycosylase family protein